MARIEDVEQALHTHGLQLHTLRMQLAETESALAGIADEAYRIVGNLMVKASPAALRAELEERKRTLTARISALETQEQKLREELRRLQDAALGDKDV